MRRFMLVIAALAGAVLTVPSSSATAAPSCASAADQSADDVLALRQLMTVLVIKCKKENEYNINFIKRFQPALQANEREVTAYFRRVYGGAGQGRKDTYTTELVNVISQQANAQGAEFCGRAGLVVNELNALRSMDELAAYAAVKDPSPAGTSMCPAGVGGAARAPRRR